MPHVEQRDPWVSSAASKEILCGASADESLLTDLADLRGALIDDA